LYFIQELLDFERDLNLISCCLFLHTGYRVSFLFVVDAAISTRNILP
jgi:hypothetical protein